MRKIDWIYKGVSIPVIEDEDGKIFCTGKMICKGLGLKEKDLYNMCLNHPQHFQDSLKYSNLAVKEFIGEHREEFGMQRVRKIYTDAELIAFAILSKSPFAVVFMQEFIQFVRSQVQMGYVSQKAHDALRCQFELQNQRLGLVEKHIERMASEDGRRLNEYKEVKKPHLTVIH
jgi:hypothetical protein